ncbi:MAG: DNA integrity scanning protein DisA nucleotide-binding domain protein [Elusimicrobia bacterium]|nr:DNA integrity scanning protein DisA nucleotide-binding domain protein [Elusimicrobiota bacterium]
MGKSPLLAKVLFSEQLGFLDELLEAVKEFSAKKIGALIALEQDSGLKNYIASGIPVHGQMTKELLCSIFHSSSPLHDGAVVIGPDGRLAAAKCLFPVTQDMQIAKAYGMRHRAAVGLAEVSDAIVIAVSEQTGQVSVARNGRLDPEVNLEAFSAEIRSLYQVKAKKSLLRSASSPAEPQAAGDRGRRT